MNWRWKRTIAEEPQWSGEEAPWLGSGSTPSGLALEFLSTVKTGQFGGEGQHVAASKPPVHDARQNKGLLS